MSTTISGTTGIDKVQDGTTINASSIMGALNATGSAPIYACRAWVNFNGTGTVDIIASGNVSSITDNGVGIYTVNFTTPMTDEKYSIASSCRIDSGGGNCVGTYVTPRTASSVKIATRIAGGSLTDLVEIEISVFR